MIMSILSSPIVGLMFFALGGLVGSARTMWRLLGLDHARLPWRARLRFYHFFGSDEILFEEGRACRPGLPRGVRDHADHHAVRSRGSGSVAPLQGSPGERPGRGREALPGKKK